MVTYTISVPRAVLTTFSDRLHDATRVTYGTPTTLTLTYPEAIPLVFPRVMRYNCPIPARHMSAIKAHTHPANLKFKLQRTVTSTCSNIFENSWNKEQTSDTIWRRGMEMWATETKERTEEPETRTIKTFSCIHMFRQQEATYRTELWSVKHSRRYCCMWKAWKSSIYRRRKKEADVNMELRIIKRRATERKKKVANKILRLE